MRHKIFRNIFVGIMAVYLICVAVVISAMHDLYANNTSVVSVIMNLRYQLLVTFVISVILSVVLSKLVYNSVIKPINDINIENPEEEVFEEIRPLVDRINAQNKQIKQQMDELKKEHE